jgi:hypothetical protein
MRSNTPRQPAGFLAPLLLTAVAFSASPAFGQAENEAAARVLFEEGRRLIKEGDYASACPKLEAAAKIDAAPGVLLNLGDCYERTNRTASAWTEFAEAEAVATRAGRDEQAKEAARRKSLLDPKLSRLVVHVTDDLPTLTVERDGALLDRSAWGVALPVDPGDHVVAAGAGGRASWTITLTVAAPGELVVEVPVLPKLPDERPPVAKEVARRIFWTPPRIAEASAVGAGVVALGVAGALALAAKGKENLAESEAGTAQVNDSWGAVHQGDVATALAVGGAVVTAAGVVLFLVAPGRTHVAANQPPFVLGGTF